MISSHQNRIEQLRESFKQKLIDAEKWPSKVGYLLTLSLQSQKRATYTLWAFLFYPIRTLCGLSYIFLSCTYILWTFLSPIHQLYGHFSIMLYIHSVNISLLCCTYTLWTFLFYFVQTLSGHSFIKLYIHSVDIPLLSCTDTLWSFLY